MKKASISILKAQLSRYLDAVKGGEEVIVTERGRPVARITAVDQDGTKDARASQLVRDGRMRVPTRQRRTTDAPPPRLEDADGRSLALLLQDRADGR